MSCYAHVRRLLFTAYDCSTQKPVTERHLAEILHKLPLQGLQSSLCQNLFRRCSILGLFHTTHCTIDMAKTHQQFQVAIHGICTACTTSEPTVIVGNLHLEIGRLGEKHQVPTTVAGLHASTNWELHQNCKVETDI